MEKGKVLLKCACDWVGHCISLIVAQDFDYSDDAGCQGVPVTVQVTSPIPDSLGKMGCGGLVLRWMVVR